MKKFQLGILLGIIAGGIDVIPMLIQKLSRDANISAFVFWIVAGFIIATSTIAFKGAIKGMIISLILLIPLAIIIGRTDPMSLIPMIIFNIILGLALGYFIDKLTK